MKETLKALSSILNKERGIPPNRTLQVANDIAKAFRGKPGTAANRKLFLKEVIEKSVIK